MGPSVVDAGHGRLSRRMLCVVMRRVGCYEEATLWYSVSTNIDDGVGLHYSAASHPEADPPLVRWVLSTYTVLRGVGQRIWTKRQNSTRFATYSIMDLSIMT